MIYRWAHAGEFVARDMPARRTFEQRSFTVGIGGPVGSGKTALVKQLCQHYSDSRNFGVVTNDIFTREDAQFLLRHKVPPSPPPPEPPGPANAALACAGMIGSDCN